VVFIKLIRSIFFAGLLRRRFRCDYLKIVLNIVNIITITIITIIIIIIIIITTIVTKH